MSCPLLATRDLVVTIAGKRVVGIDGLTFNLHPGERLVILGRNGVGKTTLLHTLAGLRTAASGEIRLDGECYSELEPRSAARLRGFLPQQQGDAFPATVLETVLIGRHPHLGRWDWESERDESLAREALTAVGLEDFHNRTIHTLSGGERQRVALATLWVQQPRLYLLDEPLAHLDLKHQIAMLDLFSHRVREDAAALVMVLHDINLAARHADQALLLFGDGTHAIGPTATLLNTDHLNRLYGHPLREISEGEGGQCWFVPELGYPRG
ncbi:iron complex transport system ATP-binding protein [Gammaproteobacteria bacterium]